jgi:hypothetical protein
LLVREGVRLNHKRLFRLYRDERLGVRKRGGRKRALGTRSPMALPEAANQCEFRRKADGGSNARRTLIPTEAGQWFQSIPDSPEAGLAVEVGNSMTGSVSP